MKKILLEICGFVDKGKDAEAAATFGMDIERALESTVSEEDHKPLIERTKVSIVWSYAYPARTRTKERYVKIYASEKGDAEEVVQVLRENRIKIAEDTRFIKTFNV
jgi:hypothetical protein